MMLPLHIFEPRYRQLMTDITDGDQQFGVVLIERGTEVGGGEVRSNIGTIAQIIEAETFDDGRTGLVAIGTRRYRVNSWLPDDPYPLADVDDYPDTPAVVADADTLHDVITKLTECLARVSELGGGLSPIPEISDDLEIGSMQAAALAPIGTFDKQRMLEAPGPDERLGLLSPALDEALELIEFRLGGN